MNLTHSTYLPRASQPYAAVHVYAVLSLLVAICLPTSLARAGESCSDACSGHSGPQSCAEFGLGCPPGGGQCIICRNDADCAPAGRCVPGGEVGTMCVVDCSASNDAGVVDASRPDSSGDASGDMPAMVDRIAPADAGADSNPPSGRTGGSRGCGCTLVSRPVAPTELMIIGLVVLAFCVRSTNGSRTARQK